MVGIFIFFRSENLLNGFNPADGNTWKVTFEFFETFQVFAQNSLDSWMETTELTNEPLVPSSLCLSLNPLIIFSPPPTLYLRLLVPFILFLSTPVLFFDDLFSQICCHRKMSRCFQPFQPALPSSHPMLPPSFSSPPSSRLWAAPVSWDTLSNLGLPPGKRPPPPPCLSASTLLLPPFLSPLYFWFHLLLLPCSLCGCINSLALLSGAIMQVCSKSQYITFL